LKAPDAEKYPMTPLTRSSTRCPNCGSEETMRLSMTLAGSPVLFTNCAVCEWRGWQREGEDLPLNSVLALASARS